MGKFMRIRTNSAIIKVMTLAGILLASGCSTGACNARNGECVTRTETIVQERYIPADPGAVEFVWEPPMVDVVDVPPGLDPEGHYYRPAHQAVVEIKQGRWQYYQDRR